VKGEIFTGPIPKPQSRAAQKKASDREKGKHWLMLRSLVAVRDKHRCRACGAPAKDVHHVKFRSAGGTDRLENLALLCRCCHAELHAYRLYAVGDNANDKTFKFRRAT
jgi:5-methylcytosine-specific restriction endonuclease McrA